MAREAKQEPKQGSKLDKSESSSLEGPAIDHDVIRALAKLLDETGLTEIEIERSGQRVRVARAARPIVSPAPAAISTQMNSEAPLRADSATVDLSKHPGVVTSPMVGTAYLGPEPGSRPFVEVGSRVRAGETVLIVEAMKTMNQIPAPRAGTVLQILVEDAQPVEYGEPLLIIE